VRTLHALGLTEEEEMTARIGAEERKLLLAQRKLESIRLLDELVERVKVTSGRHRPEVQLVVPRLPGQSR
jgi:arginine/serine-rich splicing factor 17